MSILSTYDSTPLIVPFDGYSNGVAVISGINLLPVGTSFQIGTHTHEVSGNESGGTIFVDLAAGNYNFGMVVDSSADYIGFFSNGTHNISACQYTYIDINSLPTPSIANGTVYTYTASRTVYLGPTIKKSDIALIGAGGKGGDGNGSSGYSGGGGGGGNGINLFNQTDLTISFTCGNYMDTTFKTYTAAKGANGSGMSAGAAGGTYGGAGGAGTNRAKTTGDQGGDGTFIPFNDNNLGVYCGGGGGSPYAGFNSVNPGQGGNGGGGRSGYGYTACSYTYVPATAGSKYGAGGGGGVNISTSLGYGGAGNGGAVMIRVHTV